MLWSLCIEWYQQGMLSVGQVSQWLDERWRWGTPENPDYKTMTDPSIPASAAEKAAAAGLLALAEGR